MFKIIPILAIGVLMGGAAIIKEYKNIIDSNNIDPIDYEEELKRIQNELSRLYHLKDTNDKLEVAGNLDKAEISINEVPISKLIESLTERMKILIDLKREI